MLFSVHSELCSHRYRSLIPRTARSLPASSLWHMVCKLQLGYTCLVVCLRPDWCGDGKRPSLEANEKPLAKPYVVLREEFDDWAVLFNPDTGRGFGLNPTGVYLWKLLDGRHTIDDMLETLRWHTTGAPQEGSQHLIAFIEALTQHGLAGYAREPCYDEPRHIAPFSAGLGGTQFTYQAPQLINLNGEPAIGKCCGPGTNAGGACPCTAACGNVGDCSSNGACATSNCNSTGTSALGAWCDAGSSPTYNCGNGTSPGNGHCAATGYSASGTCTTGSTASSGCSTGTST